MTGEGDPTSEFDPYVRSYEAFHAESVKASGHPTSYFAEHKVREVAAYLRGAGWGGRAINLLNFGCGVGYSEGHIRKHLPESAVYSVDTSPASVERARAKHSGLRGVHFGHSGGDGTLPFDVTFDVIFVANVLHHIPRARHLRVLRALYEVLRPAGLLFIFEHNPLNPITVRAVKACPFDKGVVLLPPRYTMGRLSEAGFGSRRLRYTLFFPGVLAFLARTEKYLRKVPLGAQYYVIAGKGTDAGPRRIEGPSRRRRGHERL